MNRKKDRLLGSRLALLGARTTLLIGLIATLVSPGLNANSRDQSPASKGKATLTFSPPRLRYCGLPVERTRIKVAWDASAVGVNYIQLYLHGTDGQLFVSSGVVGETETGEWVTNGMKFVLYSPELDEVLAEKAFRLIPCNTKKYPDVLPAEP